MTTEPRIDLVNNAFSTTIMKRIRGTSLAIYASTLPRATRELVELRVSQINGCGWCTDIHTKEAEAAGESAVRLHLVAAWRESTVFTEPERAALALAEEGTRLADAHPGVSDATWAEARRHFDDDQLVALISVIAQINATNRISLIAGHRGGGYQPGMFDALDS